MADAAFIIELLNTPGWLKYIGERNVKTVADAEKYIQNGPAASYNKNGFGLYLVKLKEGHLPVGMCGFIKRNILPHADLGFAFLPQYQGKGYAYEASAASLLFAREKLLLNTILAITVPYNESSIKLIKKINFVFEKMITMPNHPEELMLFAQN